MKCTFVLFAAVMTALHMNGATHADEGEGQGGGSVVQLRHDVTCSLFVPGGSVEAGSLADLSVVVRNRSPRAAKTVVVSVFANTATGTPLWTETMQIGPRHKRVRRLSLGVPMSAASLVAVARADADQNPGNDFDTVPVVGGNPPAGPVDPLDPVQPADPAILAGAATYASNCASCHGDDGRGTRSGPPVLRRSSGDIYEAMREGEDGMPVYLALTRTDATNMAKFLIDPTAATLPPAPVPDPAPSPDPVPSPNPDPVPAATYAAGVKPFLDMNCAGCHAGASAPKGIKLDTYANARTNASKALSSMQKGTMPPGNPSSSANIQLIADWIAGGRPQ